MLNIRRSEDRGGADFGWLKAKHSFSFGRYYDPKHMGFRSLRVINEDRVAPNSGFPTHPHDNMEIITYILEGELAHKDSMGNGAVIKPGVIQYMAAGTGVQHSEFNPSETTKTHLLQIWIEPDKIGVPPRYQQVDFAHEHTKNRLHQLVGPDGTDGVVNIHQDAKLYAAKLDAGETVTHELADGRGAWIQVTRGTLTVGDTTLSAGDGASTETPGPLTITAQEDAEFLLFDLA